MLMFIVLIFMMFILFIMFMMLVLGQNIYIFSLKLFFLNFFSEFEILFNLWNFLFMFMVLLISTSVLFFSCSYMSVYSINNFLLLYFSFIISMCWLILNNNFYWMMFGWDGLGVVSFLLIIFYLNQESSSNGLFTLFQNRIGDLFFILFMVGFINLSMENNLYVNFLMVFLVIGASVKSAQFPFNSWLLAAMSAPTPISSLVHSSTLVVAGVYILLQFSYCLLDCLEILKWLSFLTLFISMMGLINESDMKKLIAFSTMNHVALMMFMMSMKLFKITYFHLNIHAMFKSMMFMCFGFVMLASFHSQDKRMVSLLYLNPLIKMLYNYSCLCLMGLPFLSGFFSKDFIIEKSMENSGGMSSIFFLMFFMGVSIYYSFKLLQLNNNMFVLSSIEKHWVGMCSVMMMMVVSILMINIFISLIFSISLEIVSFKFFIYLLMFFFLLLNLLSNLNYKFFTYDKLKNWMEIWFFDWYKCDQFVYWTFQNILMGVAVMNNLKFILLMNWWVLLLVIFLF